VLLDPWYDIGIFHCHTANVKQARSACSAAVSLWDPGDGGGPRRKSSRACERSPPLPSATSSCSSAAYCGKPRGSRRNARESDAGGASAVSSCARRTRSRVTLSRRTPYRAQGRFTFPLRQYVASALSAERQARDTIPRSHASMRRAALGIQVVSACIRRRLQQARWPRARLRQF